MEKIILRAIELKDCDTIYKYENDTQSWNDGISTRFYSKYAIEQYVLTTQNEDITKTEQCRLMIDVVVANARKTVGCVDLYDIDFRHSKAGIGIYIDSMYRGHSYATKTLIELEKYAFNVLNIHQLYAFVSIKNTISRHLFIKNNYKHTSTLTDWLKINGIYFDVAVYQKNNGKLESK